MAIVATEAAADMVVAVEAVAMEAVVVATAAVVAVAATVAEIVAAIAAMEGAATRTVWKKSIAALNPQNLLSM